MPNLIAKPARWLPGIRDGHPLARGLVGYWPFWEGQGDKTYDVANPYALGNHGSITTGASAPDWGAGTHSTRLALGGANDYVLMDHDSRFDFAGSPWSMVTWIRPHFDLNAASGSDKFLALKSRVGAAGGQLAWFWKLDEGNDQQQFAALNAGAGIIFSIFGTATDWDANVWYQLGIVIDSAGGASFYRNGISDGTDSGAIPNSSDSNFGLGYNWKQGNQPFDGEFSNFLCWNRIVPASEIAELYADPWGLITPRTKTYIMAPAGVTGSPWYYYANQEAAA